MFVIKTRQDAENFIQNLKEGKIGTPSVEHGKLVNVFGFFDNHNIYRRIVYDGRLFYITHYGPGWFVPHAYNSVEAAEYVWKNRKIINSWFRKTEIKNKN